MKDVLLIFTIGVSICLQVKATILSDSTGKELADYQLRITVLKQTLARECAGYEYQPENQRNLVGDEKVLLEAEKRVYQKLLNKLNRCREESSTTITATLPTISNSSSKTSKLTVTTPTPTISSATTTTPVTTTTLVTTTTIKATTPSSSTIRTTPTKTTTSVETIMTTTKLNRTTTTPTIVTTATPTITVDTTSTSSKQITSTAATLPTTTAATPKMTTRATIIHTVTSAITTKPTVTTKPVVVFKPTEVLPQPAECLTATNFTDPSRSDRNGSGYKGGGAHALKGYACDLHQDTRWFRFTGAAGNRMLNTCPKMRSCGTVYPMWTDAEMPTEVGVKVSFSASQVTKDTCKNSFWPVEVMRCSTQTDHDYIYRLIHPVVVANYSCWAAFCGMK